MKSHQSSQSGGFYGWHKFDSNPDRDVFRSANKGLVAIGDMTTEEILEEFRIAADDKLKVTINFILFYAKMNAKMNPELQKAILEKYPQYLL